MRLRSVLAAVVVMLVAVAAGAGHAQAAAPVYHDAARDGGYYGATGTTTGGGGIFQDVALSVSAGELVCGSAWVRSDYPATGASGSFVVWLLGGAGSEGASAAYGGLGNLGSWTQVHTCIEATSAHPSVRIQFYPTPGGPTVDMDDVDVHTSLAVNGGFEQGGTGWSPYPNTGSNFAVYQAAPGATNPAHSGSYFGATNTAQGGGGIFQDGALNTSPGQMVCGSAWVRTEGTATGASGSFVLWLIGGGTPEGAPARYSGLGNGHAWTWLHTCIEATTSHTTLRVQFYPDPGSPTVEIDDVDVYQSLAVNGGFEQGNAGWSPYPGTATNFSVDQAAAGAANPAHSGSYFAATNTTTGGGGIYQDLSLATSPGQLVCGSAWVRTEGTATGASGAFALWLIGETNPEGATAPYGGLGNERNWSPLQTCVEATSPHSALRIQFYPTPGSPTVEIDDVDAHESIVSNGGFEDGSGPWSTFPGTDSTYEAVLTHDVLGPVVTTPQPTSIPQPKSRHALRVRLRLSWTWSRGVTRLAQIQIGSFPGRTRLTVQCLGRGCRHRALRATGHRRIHRLLGRLRGRRFRAGERLSLTLTAPGYTAERAEVTFREGRLPLARLVRP